MIVIESKKKKLLTLDVHKSLVWELMEGWGQLCQEGVGEESFPDKGNSKHKSPEIRKTVGYSGNCQRSVSLVENGVRWRGEGSGHGPDHLGLCRPRKRVGFYSKFKGKPLTAFRIQMAWSMFSKHHSCGCVKNRL